MLVAALVLLGIFIIFVVQPHSLRSLKQASRNFFGFEKENAAIVDSIVPLPEPVFSDEALKKDLIIKHRLAARAIGTRRLDNKAQLDSNIAHNRLVPIKNSKGYLVGDMTHSYPFLTPRAKRILDQIGVSFYVHSGDSSSFTVTSLTRTEETQKKLRRRNNNATREESTHCRGVSFDISYIRYNGVREWHYERTKILEGVLAALQQSGDIYVLKERNQSCFHVTVRKK